MDLLAEWVPCGRQHLTCPISSEREVVGGLQLSVEELLGRARTVLFESREAEGVELLETLHLPEAPAELVWLAYSVLAPA